ncbi:MAG: hypothetical protein GY714_21240 [Desulfobacterales bacterium]|nr:hypothetical protein [Desulfobacterales bacterium]
MGPFKLVSIIVISVVIYKMFAIWLKTKSESIDNQKIAELEQKIDELKRMNDTKSILERLSVLEDIVISKEHQLEEKFRNL